MSKKFDYKPLFSSAAPRDPRWATVRARYDFAVAYPDPESVPGEGLWRGLRDALREEARALALYPPAQGHEATRELVAEKLATDRNMKVSKEDIVLGHGSGQLIRDIIRLFVNPGDMVVTEQFFYVGTLAHLRYHQAEIVGVTMDDEGMVSEELERVLNELASQGKTVKLIYLIPGYHNPAGSVMSLERRRGILEVAHRHGVPILEDDCYVDLRYEGDLPPPAIYSLDDRGQTMYVSSFSKIVGPSVRLGWAVGPREVVGRLNAIRMDGGANSLAAMALNRYLRRDMYSHVEEINALVKVKRDAMLAALGENFPPTCRWTKPKGGLFIWLTLPEGVDAAALREKAFDAGVGYLPGVMFSPSGDERNCLRLCFGYASPDDIREGIRVLAEVFEREEVFGS